MYSETRYVALLSKWKNRTISQSEKDELLHFLTDEDIEEIEIPQSFASDKEELRKRILTGIRQSTHFPVQKRKQRQRKWLAAATVLFIIASSIFFVYRPYQSNVVTNKEENKNTTIQPGDNKAILTLADGSIIELDSSRNVALAYSHSNIRQRDIGILQVDGKTQAQSIGENVLKTPRGGQYKIVLADGTQVWLNAASSLHFPAVFSSGERKVSLDGEGYFEVAKDAKHPFVVSVSDGSEVTVLGTHFNVMSYTGENNTVTTLLEGAVQIKKQNSLLKLKPGEQAKSHGNDDEKLITDADVDAVIAWKNGVFSFDNADINTVMSQLARWYDVDVVYKGAVTDHFIGTISRSANISEVLQMLELTGTIHFSIQGKTITVSP